MQSGSSSNVVNSDSVEQTVKQRELSSSKLVAVSCGIKEIVQEVKEKSKTSVDGYLHVKNEEQVAIQVDSIVSEEQEESLEIGLDKELSKVMEVRSEISDLLSERSGHSNEAVVQVENVRDSALQGNLNVDNSVAFLSLDDGHIHRKQDEVQDVLRHCHSLDVGGHFGASKTASKVLHSSFWWPTLFKDAREFMHKYNRCQRMDNLTRKHEMPLKGILEV